MSDATPSGDDNEPAWHRLPDDPAAFFGLAEGFDRKDLKRAYNALLRRFKPDKFPQEFQKLRAAFEHLDGQLRYGEAPRLPTSRIDDYQWNPAESKATDDSPTRQEDQSPRVDQPTPDRSSNDNIPIPTPHAHRLEEPVAPKSLQERLETESLPDLYHELKSNPREPYDFYVLALLSDAVAAPKDQLFLFWLLAGIKAFPGHAALTQLLTVYFQDGDLPDDQLATVLVRLSQVIGNDRFYCLAEKLFDRLALVAPWSEVEATLNKCAANINDPNIRSQVVFTCHLLRRALWLAPIKTSQEMMDYINHHFEYLEGSLEYEQELNSLLLNYVQVRERFVTKGPIAAMIDTALRKYCLDADGRGDYEIVKVQAHIAQHPQQLFREFLLTPKEDMQLLIPWIWLSDEVEDRLETQECPPKPERLMAATFQMMQQIDRNFPLTPLKLYSSLDRIVPIAICLFLVIGLPTGLRALLDNWWPSISKFVAAGAFVTGGALATWYWFRLQRLTTGAWLINYLRRLIEKQYLKWWRSLIARYFAATHFAYRDVDRAIDALLETRRSELNICNWLPHFYSRDPALYVYATAVRFLR